MVKTIDKLINGQKIKAKKVPFLARFFMTIFLMVAVFTVAAVITYLSKELNTAPVSTYEECSKGKGSTLQKTYPAVCITKDGNKFIQPLSPEEEKLLKARTPENSEFCGGLMGKACPSGYTCKYDGNYPDAGGKCVKN